jgi:hypothetical protein
MLQIAVIDDGINEKYYNLGQLQHNIEITPKLEIKQRIHYEPYLPSHGTTCAAIIKKYSSRVLLSSVKILNDENKRGMKQQLVRAIQWCVENGIKLVNVSLGTIDYRDFVEIKEMVNQAYKKGLIIVAACNNRNIYSCPASLTNVIGVKADIGIKKDGNGYFSNDNALDGVDVTTYGSHYLVNHVGEGKETGLCNSFAAPYITAKVYGIIKDNPEITLEEIKERLRENASNQNDSSNHNIYSSLDWVEKALVFILGDGDVNTEGFVFNVKDIIKIRCSSMDTGLVEIRDYIYKAMASALDADTLVVVNAGGYKHYSTEVSRFIKDMDTCGMNTVFLDDYGSGNDLDFELNNPQRKIWHPSVYDYLRKETTMNSDIDAPIIVLYNLASNGLEEILSTLSKQFKKDGYNVLAASNSTLGVASAINYIPYDFKDFPNTFDSIKNLYAIFDPDIIIYGVNVKENFNEIKQKINEKLEPDIKVFINEERTANSEGSTAIKTDGESIILSLSKNKNNVESKTNDNPDKKSFFKLYHRIINLFKQEEAN